MKNKFLAIFGFLASLTLLASCGGEKGDSTPSTSSSESSTSECQHSFTIDNHDDSNHWKECECGEKSDVTPHTFGEWQKDETNHWKECECGAKSGEGAHDLKPNHDETNHWTECECGEKTEVTPHAFTIDNHDETNHWKECECGAKTEVTPHAFGDWQKDDAKHWKECACGAKSSEGAHDLKPNYDENNHWTECECGEKTEVAAHAFTIAKQDETNHWKECECGAKTEVTPHAFTIANKDETNHWKECECGAKTEVTPHAFTIANKDETNHWTECECGAKSDVTPHAFGEWQKDETNHWKECDCGETTEKVAHAYTSWNTEDEKYDYKACECGALDKTQKFAKRVSLINQDFLLTGTSFKLNISGVDAYTSVESITLGTYDLGADLTALQISEELKADTKSHGKQTIVVTLKDKDGASHTVNVPVTLITKEIANGNDFKSIQPKAGVDGALSQPVYGYYILKNDISDNSLADSAYCKDWEETTGFFGTFDGQGHTISTAANGTSGIFGILRGATIKNVTIKDNWRSAGQYYALLAKAVFNSTLQNVTFQYAVGNTQATLGNGYGWIAYAEFSGNTLKDVTVNDTQGYGSLFGYKFTNNTFDNVTINGTYQEMGHTHPVTDKDGNEIEPAKSVSYDDVTKATPVETQKVQLKDSQYFVLDGETSVLDLGDYNDATLISIKTSTGFELYGLSSDVATDIFKNAIKSHGVQNFIITVLHEGNRVEITAPVIVVTKSIKTMADLQASVKVTSTNDKNIYGYYTLANDVSYTDKGYTFVSSLGGWSGNNAFRGTLDGRGHMITVATNMASNGLFGVMNEATLKNIKIKDLWNSNRSILAQSAYNVTFEDVEIEIAAGSVLPGGNDNTPIIGYNLTNVTMKNVTIISKVDMVNVFATEQGKNTFENVVIKANVTGDFSLTNKTAPSGVTIQKP